MTQKELAEALGISQAAVSKLARRGMPTDSVERASRWRRRHLQTGRMKGMRADTIAPKPKATEAPDTGPTAPEDLDLFLDEDPEETRPRKFLEARERREHYAAEMAKLNFERECGRLLLASEVIGAVASAATDLRTSLEALPQRLAPILVNKGEHSIAAHIAAEIENILENLSFHFANLAKTATQVEPAK